MTQLFILFEHAAGYALFKIQEFEEIGALVPQVEQSVTDLARFGKVVRLHAQTTFQSAIEALESVNSISEGILPESLRLFLELQFPKLSKRSKCTIGVSEPKLAASITELLSIPCVHTGVVNEIHRGIRFHFHHLLENFTHKSSEIAQLALGHSYSRAKVKFNVNKVDNMIIQSIALLDQLDKDINSISMRIREWYSYHFPELFKILPEYYLYAKAARFIGNRKELSEEKLEQLEEIVMDSAKARAIYDASRSSMGMDISPIDLLNIDRCTGRVIGLIELRTNTLEYLRSKMNNIAPNLSSILGEQVGARLISKAGSLTNLAKAPASTVQILGAEKALFRALKTRSKTPKYGIIYNTTYIGKAGTVNKGRMSRLLANKCAIASRIDCFSDIPSNIFGEKLKHQLEERLKYYETGDPPLKNVDVMQEAILEYNEFKRAANETPKKKKKKKKSMDPLNVTETAANENGIAENNIAQNGNDVEQQEDGNEEITPKKKKKKRKSLATVENSDVAEQQSFVDATEDTTTFPEETHIKKKKKKSQTAEFN